MEFKDVAEYLSRARVIDLSKRATPGAAEGPLDAGKRPSLFGPWPLKEPIEGIPRQ